MFAVLMGCDSAGGPDAGPENCDAAASSEGMALEVGTGQTEFEPLQTRDSIPITYGPQGGTHLWIALRVRGAEEVSPVQLQVRSPDGIRVFGAQSAVTVNLGPTDNDGWRERAGLFGFLDDPEEVRDQAVILWARVGDCQRAIEGEAAATAQ